MTVRDFMDPEVLAGIGILTGAALLFVRQIRREFANRDEAACGHGCSGCAIGESSALLAAFDDIARKIEEERARK